MFPWERKEKITPRQQQIMDLKIRGYKHKQIAEILGIGVDCVNQLSSRARKRQWKIFHQNNLRSI